MKRFSLACLSVLVALSLCACVHYVPRDAASTQTSTEAPTESSSRPDGTSTTEPTGTSVPGTDTTAPDEVTDGGFPNETEPDGTKRY